jgi:CcmD family protein
MIIKKIFLAVSLFLLPYLVMAQVTAGDQVEMADLMRSNGKIYVVVTVLVIIMTGLFSYLIKMDLKLNQLEKRISSKNPS